MSIECGFCIATDLAGCEYEGYEVALKPSPVDSNCYECGSSIIQGQMIEIASGEWDGEQNTHYTCLVCAEIASAFCCEGRMHGSLWDDLGETLEEENLTTACFDRLKTAAAKRELQEFWIGTFLGC